MLRVIYFGSSDFSIPSLKACLEAPGYEVVGVITTPPQRQGRGLELTPTIVAKFCAEKNIPYREYAKLDESALVETASLRPDVFVVASYGKIIPESFLKLAQFRFNIHPSLLPKYRGASPLNGPILAGDIKTGLSIADVTKSLDAGDLYYQEEIPLSSSSDSEQLSMVLSEKSHFAMRQVLETARVGNLKGTPQTEDGASYASKLSKEDGRLFLNQSALHWDRIVRGLKPWPGAFTEVHGERVNIVLVKAITNEIANIKPIGTILKITDESMIIKTSEGDIEWLQVKPAGKKVMSGADYARGRRWQAGMQLQ